MRIMPLSKAWVRPLRSFRTNCRPTADTPSQAEGGQSQSTRLRHGRRRVRQRKGVIARIERPADCPIHRVHHTAPVEGRRRVRSGRVRRAGFRACSAGCRDPVRRPRTSLGFWTESDAVATVASFDDRWKLGLGPSSFVAKGP
jgi:hypothetical protein